MKKFLLICSLSFIAICVNSQTKILVDDIHGGCFFPSHFTWYAEEIQFDSIFETSEITLMSDENIPFDDVLFEGDFIETDTVVYTVDIPDMLPSYPIAIYVVVTDSTSGTVRCSGTITSPDEFIVAEMYNGIMHYDGATGSGWRIHVFLQAYNYTYHVKVGYGPVLFSASDSFGAFDVKEYDVLVRIIDNTYYALTGTSVNYSELDRKALKEAFQEGLGFIHVVNRFVSMADKPFVHFRTNEPLYIDYKINMMGSAKLLRPLPVNKSDQIVEWKNHTVKPDSFNEIIWETGLSSGLNFLHFEVNDEMVIAGNLIDHTIQNLALIKFDESTGKYLYQKTDQLYPKEKHAFHQWGRYESQELLGKMQSDFYNSALKAGLSEKEARHFVYQYNWIQSLLSRAYYNPHLYFGFYKIGTALYNELFPVQVNPKPQHMHRNMWVMLSNIQNLENKMPIKNTCSFAEKDLPQASYEMIEYGVVNEYYSFKNANNDELFFGLETDEYLDITFTSHMNFYTNDLAVFLSQNVEEYTTYSGSYSFVTDFPINSGILFHPYYFMKPVAAWKKIYNHGKLIAIGSSDCFRQNPDNRIFINNCVEAMLSGELFVNTDEPKTKMAENDSQVIIYPNPFRHETAITITLKIHSNLQLEIMDINGRQIKQLINARVKAGQHTFYWKPASDNTSILSSGIYFCKIQTEQEISMMKILYLKTP